MNNGLDKGITLVTKLSRPARLVGVGILALILLIPLAMIDDVVRERHQTYRGVIDNIAGGWSGDQVLAGPILVVPFTEKLAVLDEVVTPGGQARVSQRWEKRDRTAVLLPDRLDLDGSLESEVRRRGIYEVQVYQAGIDVSATFSGVEAAVTDLSSVDRLDAIHWDDAVLAVGISDPRGIVEADRIDCGDHRLEALPGSTIPGLLPRGFHLPVGEVVDDHMEIRMPLKLRGTGSFQFVPLGATTMADLRSSWPTPSFIGEILPKSRTIEADGFEARWSISRLNRSYPQGWVEGESVDLNEIVSGVRLFEPVQLYDLVTRATKYGLLFIILTFLTLGLIELVTDERLSLVQYLLIGVALALFFLILIAFAEHIGFGTAYVIASAIVIGMNSLYCAALLTRKSLAIAVGGVLTAIYGILYTILKAEDFALLSGTVLLVVALSVTMYFTKSLHKKEDREW